MPATKDPWEFDRELGIVWPTEKPEHIVCFMRCGLDDEEACANGALIAGAPDMAAALIKLSNEVLGTLPLMEAVARREFGNTNYSLLIQRAEEARVLIEKITEPPIFKGAPP